MGANSGSPARRAVVLFTAPSGLRVLYKPGLAGDQQQGGLAKLVRYAERLEGLGSAMAVKLEDGLADAHYAAHPNIGTGVINAIHEQGGLQYLLLYGPQDYVRGLWKASAEAELAKIPDSVPAAFVSLHAVLYHTQSREFFPWVDPEMLRSWAAATDRPIACVVTLIDDVYDAAKWLSQSPNGLWFPLRHVLDSDSPVLPQALDSAINSVHHLLVWLTWRSLEVFHAAELARALGVPHYLVGVKHELGIVYDLILNKRPPVYLSHPISEPRRLLREGLSAEYRSLVDEVHELTGAAARSRAFVPLSPTAIDELRFELEKSSDSSSVNPELLERWTFPDARETLHMPPPDPPGVSNLFDPQNVAKLPAYGEFAHLLRPLLRTLSTQMEMQIDSRDRRLVQQARGILVWRPYFNGHYSRGVKTELNQRNNLVDYGIISEGSVRSFIYRPKSDLGRYRARTLLSTLLGVPPNSGDLIRRVEHGRYNIASMLTAEDKQRLIEILEQPAVIAAFESGNLDGEEIRRRFDPGYQFTFGSLASGGPMSGETEAAHRADVSERWSQVCADSIARDELRNSQMRAGDEMLEDEATPAEFVTWVESRFAQDQTVSLVIHQGVSPDA